VGRRHPLEGVLRDLGREGLVERVTVRRLSLEETTQMTALTMGQQAVSEEFAGFVYRRTKGNPRLVEGMIRSLGGRLQLTREILPIGGQRLARDVVDNTKHRRLVRLRLLERSMDRRVIACDVALVEHSEPVFDALMQAVVVGFGAHEQLLEIVRIQAQLMGDLVQPLVLLELRRVSCDVRQSMLHIDLNDQNFARFDQDFRFGSHNVKQAFLLVKFLEDVGYAGSRHFDAHAYRTEDYDGVKDFARGCMRTYLILKEKAARWNANEEIQSILKEVSSSGRSTPKASRYSEKGSVALLSHVFDKDAILKKRLPYERLDQLTVDILLGAR